MLKYTIKPEIAKQIKHIGLCQKEDNRINNTWSKVSEQNTLVFCIFENKLYRLHNQKWEVLLPVSIINGIIWESHESLEHAGFKKCYKVMRELHRKRNGEEDKKPIIYYV